MTYVTLLLAACSTSMAGTEAAPPLESGQAEAIFAGGCFWCMESDFEHVAGVIDAVSGYTGGEIEGPTYKQVSYHQTKHFEAVRVIYDPSRLSYAQLLDTYWRSVDPTQADGQFCDKGHQYRAAIFPSTPEERALAEKTRADVARRLGEPVVTEILPASTFWVAEDYHQDFYKNNPTRYHSYREGCGRDARTKELWGSK